MWSAITNWWTYASSKQRFNLIRNFLIIGSLASVVGICSTGTFQTQIEEGEEQVEISDDTKSETITPTLEPTLVLREMDSTPGNINYEELVAKLLGQNLDNLVRTAIQEAMDKRAIATSADELREIDKDFLSRLEAIENETGVDIDSELNISILPTPTPTPPPTRRPLITVNSDGVIVTATPVPDVLITPVPEATEVVIATPTPIPAGRAVSPIATSGAENTSGLIVSPNYINYSLAKYSLNFIEVTSSMDDVSKGLPFYAQLWVTNKNYTETSTCSSEVPYFFIRDGSKSYSSDIVEDYHTEICLNNYLLSDTRPVHWLDAIWTTRDPQDTCIRYSGTDSEGNPACVKYESNIGFWNMTLAEVFGIAPYTVVEIGSYILYVFNESGEIISRKVLNE